MTPRAATKRQADPVDRHVGHRIRLRRHELGMTQQQLAESVGITFQQLQKYERATNRISAGRLYSLSFALGVPVSWFFEGAERHSGKPGDLANAHDADIITAMASCPDVLDAARCLLGISNANTRRQLVKIIQAFSEADAS